MPSRDFPNAPEAGQAFSQVNSPPPKAPTKTGDEPFRQEPPAPDIDHLDLATLDYTPGGSLEYEVHRDLSDNARRQYLEQTRQETPSEEKFYADQIDRQFERAAQRRVERLAPTANRDESGDGHEPTSPDRANKAREQREADTKTKQQKGDREGKDPAPPADPLAPEHHEPLARDEFREPERASRFDRNRSGGHDH
jgi:ADP-ribose pyrophosphatase YjhB (NUDIX family)